MSDVGRQRRFVVDRGTAAQRIEAWASVMAPSGRVEIEDHRSTGFRGEVRSYSLGEAIATRVSSDDYRFVRDETLMGKAARDLVFVNYIEAGRIEGHLAGRRIDVPSGGVVISRLRTAMDVRLEDATWFAFMVPLSRITQRLSWRPGLDARIFKPGSSSAVLLGHHLRSLMELPNDLSAAAANRIGGQSLRFLLPHLGATGERDEVGSRAGGDLSFAVRQFIADRLRDPNLDAALICREFALSRSRLYRIFEEGDGVAAVIRRLRLLCAYREIASGGAGEMSVAQMAARWGFANARTFQRAFNLQFDTTPALLRKRASANGVARLVDPSDAAAEIDRWFGS